MSLDYLEFEKPIAELQEKITELKRVNESSEVNLEYEIDRLHEKSSQLTKEIFSKLDTWQIIQIARHPLRPYTLDYIDRIVVDFQELHGDRMYSDDPAIVTGLGWIGERRVAIIGHQKGRDTKERTRRNFGMARPEGYRKAQRIMRLAEQFGLAVVTFIDTAGAWPGVAAEKRGQSQAIAQSIEVMTRLKSPIISVVIGEGGSGGALAIGVCDKLLMLKYATYSVISPEGCAALLWKSREKAADAADAMRMTTHELSKVGLVDDVIAEPTGGAHRDYDETAMTVRLKIIDALREFESVDSEKLLENRYARLMNFGKFEIKN